MAPPPGRMPRIEPRPVPRSTGPMIRLKSAFDSIRPLTCLTMTLRVCSCSRLRRISPRPKTPMLSATKFSPSAISGMSKVKRWVPVSTSLPTRPEQQAEHDHGEGLEQRAAGQRHRGHQPQHHQREVLRRAELERHVGQRRGRQHQQDGRDRAGEEGAQRGGGERRAGAALFGHLVAVDRRDHARTFARQVDQDRGGGAAVLRAVIDAGQHDQGRRPAAGRR